MSDSDQQRAARSLNNIDHHLRELVKVLATLNENFVAVGKDVKTWIGLLTDQGVEVDLDQLIEYAKDPEKAKALKDAIQEDTETN